MLGVSLPSDIEARILSVDKNCPRSQLVGYWSLSDMALGWPPWTALIVTTFVVGTHGKSARGPD